MSKDWLEDKKEQLKNADVFINENGNKAVEVSLSVLNKLIKQAEQLELYKKRHKLLIHEVINKGELEQQNKRYREALQAISDLEHIEKCLDEEVVQVARGALEGDSE